MAGGERAGGEGGAALMFALRSVGSSGKLDKAPRPSSGGGAANSPLASTSVELGLEVNGLVPTAASAGFGTVSESNSYFKLLLQGFFFPLLLSLLLLTSFLFLLLFLFLLFLLFFLFSLFSFSLFFRFFLSFSPSLFLSSFDYINPISLFEKALGICRTTLGLAVLRAGLRMLPCILAPAQTVAGQGGRAVGCL